MVTLNGRFDGKTIVLDEPSSLQVAPGTRLRVAIQPIDEPQTQAMPPQAFRPLNIHVDPEIAKAIALEAEFNIEEA